MVVVTKRLLQRAKSAGACKEAMVAIRVNQRLDSIPAEWLGWRSDLVTESEINIVATELLNEASVRVSFLGGIDPYLLGSPGYGSGSGDGDGDGYGYGSGYGSGSGDGDGYGSGSGSGSGDGYGYGYGYGSGSGYGYGDGYGYGYGYGSGYGDRAIAPE